MDRLGHHEAAATTSGCAASTYSETGTPEINPAIAHLSEVLGHEIYQSLARSGAKMTTAAMVTFAFEQIDRVRAQLARDGESA